MLTYLFAFSYRQSPEYAPDSTAPERVLLISRFPVNFVTENGIVSKLEKKIKLDKRNATL